MRHYTWCSAEDQGFPSPSLAPAVPPNVPTGVQHRCSPFSNAFPNATTSDSSGI